MPGNRRFSEGKRSVESAAEGAVEGAPVRIMMIIAQWSSSSVLRRRGSSRKPCRSSFVEALGLQHLAPNSEDEDRERLFVGSLTEALPDCLSLRAKQIYPDTRASFPAAGVYRHMATSKYIQSIDFSGGLRAQQMSAVHFNVQDLFTSPIGMDFRRD